MRGEKTISELAQAFGVHPNQITQWRDQLITAASGVFDARWEGGRKATLNCCRILVYWWHETDWLFDIDVRLLRVSDLGASAEGDDRDY